jgi:hypothetical protein
MTSKTIRNVFLVLFILSTVAMALLFYAESFSLAAAPATPPPAAMPTPSPIPQDANGDGQIDKPAENPGTNIPPTTAEPAESSTGSFAVASSLAASAASLIGFLTTTVITWRKEKRESDLALMERKKLELELEKSKLELEELKRENKK